MSAMLALRPWEPVVGGVLLVLLAVYLLNQVRKPTRWVGRLFLGIMNRSHSRLTDWGLTHVRIDRAFTILDVGCGGGRTIQKLAALAAEGRVCGVDPANGSVAASRSNNAPAIAAGRVEIKQASVSQLPFPEATFDLVTAVETHYYWPDLVAGMQEILRVLKPGGSLIVIAESRWKAGHAERLASAGYTDIQVFEGPKQGWTCGTGTKPSRV
jgi:SAM-dependent methyltransferase